MGTVCHSAVSPWDIDGTPGVQASQEAGPGVPGAPGGGRAAASSEPGRSDGAVCAQRWKFLRVLFLRVTVNSSIWYVAVWATGNVFPSHDVSGRVSWVNINDPL